MNPHRRTCIIAGILFLADALVLNQGVLAGIALLGVLFYRIPKAVHAAFRKNADALRLHGTKSVLYSAAAFAVFGANALNNRLAERRLRGLIVACREYEKANGRLPDRLGDLVPDQLPGIPAAKFTLMNNDFIYVPNEKLHLLGWRVFPPFGRRFYAFESDSWSSMD